MKIGVTQSCLVSHIIYSVLLYRWWLVRMFHVSCPSLPAELTLVKLWERVLSLHFLHIPVPRHTDDFAFNYGDFEGFFLVSIVIFTPWKSKTKQRMVFRMIHGARIPDPTNGQSLVFGLPGYRFYSVFVCVCLFPLFVQKNPLLPSHKFGVQHNHSWVPKWPRSVYRRQPQMRLSISTKTDGAPVMEKVSNHPQS